MKNLFTLMIMAGMFLLTSDLLAQENHGNALNVFVGFGEYKFN